MAEALRTSHRELISRGDTLFSKRSGLHSLWQAIAENFHVMRADFTRMRSISEEFASHLMTGRPALAHRDLSNALPAMMRPRDRQWLWARTSDKRVNKDREARAYLDWMSETQSGFMYDPRAGMVRACKEVDGDYSAFGQGVLTVEPNQVRDGLLIRSYHLRDVAWTEGYDLTVNQVHHKRKETARDLCRLFPSTVSAKVRELLAKEPDKEIDCRRIVIPADESDATIRNKARTPFVSHYIDIENAVLLEETPVRTRGYVIPRWATVSGSQYAYSPATVYGLPDSRLLQQITLTMLEAGQKAVDPPMVAVTEAIAGGVNTGAGMITWTDADYDERTGEVLRPMEMRFDGIKFGAEARERLEGLIDAAFFLNQIRFPQITKDMTAFEVGKLYEEFQRNSLPLLEPIEVEYNGGLCTEVYEQLLVLGKFGSPYDMPELLRDRELRWEFDTPLKAAAEQAKVFSFAAFTDTLAKGMQIDKTVVFNADIDKATREALIGTGGADWLRDPKEAEALKQRAAQVEAAAQQANAMATGADVASRVADAARSAGEARTAMVESGLAL